MSLFNRLNRNKYAGDLGPEGQRLAWPGTPEGFPVLIDPKIGSPLTKQTEYENMPVRLDYSCDWFDLDDAEQLQKFREIMDRITNGVYLRLKRTDVQKSDGGLRVFLEWAKAFGVPERGH